jgi:hypothetical protein
VKDRLLTLMLAFGALAASYLFLFPKPAPVDEQASFPLSTDSGIHGYLAAWRWLKQSGTPIAALRNRYDHLTAAGFVPSPSGNVMLTTMPFRLATSIKEEAPLNAWIEQGNTLVVMAALDDTPDWALTGGRSMEEALKRMLKLEVSSIRSPDRASPPARDSAPRADADAAASAAPPPTPTFRERVKRLVADASATRTFHLSPIGSHPLLEGVGTIIAYSELPADRWKATPTDAALLLAIAGLEPAGDAAVWLKRQGSGQILVIGVAGGFANRAIGEADNARFLANIIAWSRAQRGTVIFDDAHQGAVSYYDPKAFFADPRLHRTLLWVLVVWFLFVLGAQTFRVRDAQWRPVDVTAFVGASGEFFAGVLSPPAAAERLLANFFNALRRRLGLSEDGEPVWTWLEAQAVVSSAEFAELRRQHAKAVAGQRVDLVRLQNLLSRLQGALL